jgi:hypothetical protein
MTPNQSDRLETEFGIRFPDEYRSALCANPKIVTDGCVVVVDPSELAEMNRQLRENPPWTFDWKSTFWCIGCSGISGTRGAIAYYFINAVEDPCNVYTLYRDDPGWSIEDRRRVPRIAFPQFLDDLHTKVTGQLNERRTAIDAVKRQLRQRWWHRIRIRRRLPEPPKWMLETLTKRTGLDAARCHELLNAATAVESWAAACSRDPNEYRRMATEDAFAEARLDSFLKSDPIERDDRYGAVMLRAQLQAGKEIAEAQAGRHISIGGHSKRFSANNTTFVGRRRQK